MDFHNLGYIINIYTSVEWPIKAEISRCLLFTFKQSEEKNSQISLYMTLYFEEEW